MLVIIVILREKLIPIFFSYSITSSINQERSYNTFFCSYLQSFFRGSRDIKSENIEDIKNDEIIFVNSDLNFVFSLDKVFKSMFKS